VSEPSLSIDDERISWSCAPARTRSSSAAGRARSSHPREPARVFESLHVRGRAWGSLRRSRRSPAITRTRSWCARTANRMNERLDFLCDRSLCLVLTHYSSSTSPSSEGSALRGGRRLVNSAVRRGSSRFELDASPRHHAPRQTVSTRPAVAPSRRSSPTHSRRRRCVPPIRVSLSRATSFCSACPSRIADAAAGPGGRDYNTRLQEATAARLSVARFYVVRDEARITRSDSFAAVYVNDLSNGEGAVGPRSKPAVRRVIAWTLCRTYRGQGAQMPELPEGRGSCASTSKEVSVKKIKSVEVTGARSVSPAKNKKESSRC